MMQKLLLTVLLSLLFNQVYAQNKTGSISGKVTSHQGTPLPDINVGLRGTPYGSLTDKNGVYNISGVADGHYTIDISGIGFDAHTKKSI
ncbi:carboxypeptidase-like regulatory domain-containing protein [Dyadobacter sp. NIV53]|uniref:carboxypeptidase-like regulatory domain-containing protein n=1 Tax=Dyadobacter sp. NIV53 TaxID=2861765 RepID=UPI001C8841E6|nr:carboxypeptidase-like regulatory domain-containing protein [Dyadobacter sp. NIV53]